MFAACRGLCGWAQPSLGALETYEQRSELLDGSVGASGADRGEPVVAAVVSLHEAGRVGAHPTGDPRAHHTRLEPEPARRYGRGCGADAQRDQPQVELGAGEASCTQQPQRRQDTVECPRLCVALHRRVQSSEAHYLQHTPG